MNESLLVTRASRPSKPASTSSATTPSETPPVRRVSSTTSTRRVAHASRSDVLDRERREPAQVDDARADPPLLEPRGRRAATSAGRSPTSRSSGRRRRRSVRAEPERARARRSSAASQPSSPSSWRSRVWYSAIGSRKTQTLPSTVAAATHVPSIAAASSGRAGEAITSAGDVAQHADRVVVVEVAAEALLVAVARRSARPSRCGTRPARRTAASPPRRAADPRRCGGRRGTGSRGSAAKPADRRAEREPEDRRLVEQRVEHAPRAEARVQPARDAVDAALRRDVLAEERAPPGGARARRRARVDRLGERQRLVAGEPDARRASSATAAGERGASGAHHLLRGGRELRQRASPRAPSSRTASRGREVLVGELLPARAPGRRRASARSRAAGRARSRRGSRAASGTPSRRRRPRG